MEQQTISVAKAGITTILNSRTSVLAAANPIFGRYDDMKIISDQIDLQTTILSRFDCIFIVRDQRDPKEDKLLAEHLIEIHKGGRSGMEVEDPTINIDLLRKYIYYARTKVSPRLNEVGSLIFSLSLICHYRKLPSNYKTFMLMIGKKSKKPNRPKVKTSLLLFH